MRAKVAHKTALSNLSSSLAIAITPDNRSLRIPVRDRRWEHANFPMQACYAPSSQTICLSSVTSSDAASDRLVCAWHRRADKRTHEYQRNDKDRIVSPNIRYSNGLRRFSLLLLVALSDKMTVLRGSHVPKHAIVWEDDDAATSVSIPVRSAHRHGSTGSFVYSE